MKRDRTGPVPFLFGGRACLDFVNTVNSRSRPATREYLADFEDLLGWATQVDLFEGGKIARLRSRARENVQEAQAAYLAAIEFREVLCRIFQSRIRGARTGAADIARLETVFVRAANARNLVEATDGFDWSWKPDYVEPDLPMLAVSLSAVDLLTTGDLGRIKECPGPEGCGWMFYDQTKNASRRWCSMDHCGGAAKARRFAGRQREKTSTKASGRAKLR